MCIIPSACSGKWEGNCPWPHTAIRAQPPPTSSGPSSPLTSIFSVLYTLDARYVCTGSDDGNVRLWKARASEKLGILGGREMAAREYRQGLRTRWQAVGDVGRIERQRHVPKPIKSAQQLKRTMLDARRVKEENRRKHTKVWTIAMLLTHAASDRFLF